MKTYLLTWNPQKWIWGNLQDDIAQIDDLGYCEINWSCGVTKRIQPGDRIFLMKLGTVPRGIVASGWAVSNVFEDVYWGDENRKALYINVYFDVILDENKDQILKILSIENIIYEKMNWTPQASGIRIPDDVAIQLEKDWANYNEELSTKRNHEVDNQEYWEQFIFLEGKEQKAVINRFERNTAARAICIREYGVTCSVCGFNFEEKYGEIGKGFIHVHHIIPLSIIRESYQLNPIEDLRPVCPNCHAMLHRVSPTMKIDDLKSLINI